MDIFMRITEDIIKVQLEKDYYEDKQPDYIAGLAQRAVEFGFDQLSEKQQAILKPHLSQACQGIDDPGGYHNDCNATLEGEALLAAYEQENYHDALICPSCTEEADFYEAQWEKFSKD